MKLQKIIHFSLGPIGAAILGLLTTPLLTWFFSVEDIGRYSILQITITFSTILFSLGLDQAFVREFYEHKNPSQIFKIACLPSLTILLIAAIPILIFYHESFSYSLYQLNYWQLSFLTIICCISSLLIRFLSLYIRMEERGIAFSMSQLLPKILFLIQISFIFLLFKNKHFDFLILLQIQAISLTIVMCLFILLNRSHLKSILHSPWRNAIFFKMLKYGFPLIVSGLIYWLITSTSRLVLLHYSNLTELGIFSAVTSVAAGAAILSSIFNTLWAPSIYKWHQAGVDKDQLFIINELLLAAVYFICILTSIFSWVFLYVLPTTYNSIIYLLAAAVIQPLLYALSEATSIGITIQRKTSLSILISGITLIVNSLLCIFLTLKLGARGTIIATAWGFWLFFILRTEASARTWVLLPRIKMYLMTFIVTLIVTYIALTSPQLLHLVFIQLFALGLGVLVFYKQIFQLKKTLSSFIVYKKQ